MSTVMEQMLRLDFSTRYRMSSLPITTSNRPGESRSRRVLRHLRQRLLLGLRLRQDDIDIVHVHTCSGFSFHRSAWDLRVARQAGRHTVLHMHGAQFDEYFANASTLEKELVRRTLRRADRVIALSPGWLSRLRAIEPSARIVVIENAVAPADARLSRPVNGICRFLMLARMDAWKGVDDLLAACQWMQNCGVPFALTLAGPEGTAGNAAELARKIGKLAGQVRYVGPVEGEAKSRLMAESDVLVQPSHQEGMPLSVLEAFSHGRPVIATRVGAVPEVLEHQVQGLLVPPRDPRELARAMSVLAIDPPMRKLMGETGRRVAGSRFSLSRFRDDLIELYDGLIRTSRQAMQTRNDARQTAMQTRIPA
jgi:glycosyltransferase involved in cell wall biosynthesis